MIEELTGMVAIICSLGIPVIAIICVTIKSIKKRNAEKEIRKLIIENNTDIEVAKQLIDEPERKTNKYVALRWSCVLIGMGFGALANFLLGVTPTDNIYFWFIVAFGVGLGLLTSFVVELKLQMNQNKGLTDIEEN